MHRKDVQRLERHRVIAAEHVLVAKQVGEICRQSFANALICHLGNQAATLLKSKQLSRAEHFAVVLVAPAVQPLSLVAIRNSVVWDELTAGLAQPPFSLLHLREIRRGRTLEEPTFRPGAMFAVIFDREHPVLWNRPVTVLVLGTAMPTKNTGFSWLRIASYVRGGNSDTRLVVCDRPSRKAHRNGRTRSRFSGAARFQRADNSETNRPVLRRPCMAVFFTRRKYFTRAF